MSPSGRALTPAFDEGEGVVIIDRSALDERNRRSALAEISDEQLRFAGAIASVNQILHTGNEIAYVLAGVPGVWREEMLRALPALDPNDRRYDARYPAGTRVEVAPLEALRAFQRTWTFHHPLSDEQLSHAGTITDVKSVAYYHGGDPLYELEGVPGIWHEQCLRPSPLERRHGDSG